MNSLPVLYFFVFFYGFFLSSPSAYSCFLPLLRKVIGVGRFVDQMCILFTLSVYAFCRLFHVSGMVWGLLNLALPCPALPCPALPCPALPCPALPCPALPCITSVSALPCPASPVCLPCPAPPGHDANTTGWASAVFAVGDYHETVQHQQLCKRPLSMTCFAGVAQIRVHKPGGLPSRFLGRVVHLAQRP